jgi:hypothetical protein
VFSDSDIPLLRGLCGSGHFRSCRDHLLIGVGDIIDDSVYSFSLIKAVSIYTGIDWIVKPLKLDIDEISASSNGPKGSMYLA